MIKNRNVALYIVLSIVTCGIFALYWFVCLADDANTLSNNQGTSGGVALLLTLVTCGIYGIYWAYKLGESLDALDIANGKPQKNRAIVYLLLNIFGLGIITFALAQSSINEYASSNA